jgi:hypothetical protein
MHRVVIVIVLTFYCSLLVLTVFRAKCSASVLLIRIKTDSASVPIYKFYLAIFGC